MRKETSTGADASMGINKNSEKIILKRQGGGYTPTLISQPQIKSG